MAEAAAPTYAELRRDLPRRSPRAWGYAGLAALSRAGGLLSTGLRIGHTHGFDSGPFMSHVYSDTASGRTPLGRRLDRRLLDRPTCEAFRDIRRWARRAVAEALADTPGPTPLVADMAAGPAAYLLEALAAHPTARALLRDTDPAALAQAAAAARAAGVADRVRTERADAFDRDALARISPRPDVVLELGLYGMYADDALIARHLADLAEVVAPREIVMNVQTENPEIERIARVWRDRSGGRCVWRLRPAEQVLAWAADAGYRPVWMQADRHGIYRVARLRRAA